MDFNNTIIPQTVDNETGGIQTTRSSTLRRCIRSKMTWITFAILIILAITIPTTIILSKKENPQETSITALTTTATILTTVTTPTTAATIVTTAKPITTTATIVTIVITPTTTATLMTTATIVTTENSLTTTEGIDMLMNTTGITLPHIILNPNCNVKDCRARIADYFSKNWAFHTNEFVQCNQCPEMSYRGQTINYSPDWFPMWLLENFFIKNSSGQDCEKNPIKGNKLDCMVQCFKDTTCVAFSRQKIVGDDDRTGECWLKKNITINQIPNDPEWHTIIFNAKS